MEKDISIKDKREENQELNNFLTGSAGTAGVYLGSEAIKSSVPEITGLETGGHITRKENADKILNEGLKGSLANTTDNSIRAGIPSIKGSEGHVYGYKTNDARRSVRAGIINSGASESELSDLKYRIPYEDIRTKKVQLTDNPELRGLSKDDFAKYLAIRDKELREQFSVFRTDPFETVSDTSKKTDSQLVKERLNDLAKKHPNILDEYGRDFKEEAHFVHNMLGDKNTHTFKGDLPAHYFKDSPHKKAYTPKDFLTYAKNNKLRFGKGLGKGVAGTGLVGGGSYLFLDALKRSREQNKEQTDA